MSHSSGKAYSQEFWDLLKEADGAFDGHINMAAGFGVESVGPIGDKHMQSKTAQGVIHCGAYKTGASFNLDVVDADTPNAVKVFWLPWVDKRVTHADRKDFETTDCQFFLTARLEGCRFALTAEKVLHVASNAGGALEGALGSATRDRAQEVVGGKVPSRRLSISSSNVNTDWEGYPYTPQAFVFGINYGETWKYKALIRQRLDDKGSWTTFMDPG